MLDSRRSRSGVKEFPHENGAHRDNFVCAADRSDNSWRFKQKAGQSGSQQGGRLLLYVPADLSVAAQFRTVGL